MSFYNQAGLVPQGVFGLITSLSATSDPISCDTYSRLTLFTNTLSYQNIASTASGVGDASLTYNPEWSDDGGETWVQLSEINGHAVSTSMTDYPVVDTGTIAIPLNRAYVYPAAFPLFRLRISNGPNDFASAIMSNCSVSLTP